MTLHELWDELMRPERRWFGFMLFVSLLGHAGVFFIFQTPAAHPSKNFIHPTKVEWIGPLNSSFASPSIQRNNIQSWLALMDPRRIAIPSATASFEERISSSADREWLDFSFEELLPAQTDASSHWQMNVPETFLLAEQAANSILKDRISPMPLSVEAPPRVSGTVVEIRGELAARRLFNHTSFPQPKGNTAVEPTYIRLFVDSEGVVIAALLEKTSTSSELDNQALQLIQKWQFEPSKKSLQQAIVGVFWDQRSSNLE